MLANDAKGDSRRNGHAPLAGESWGEDGLDVPEFLRVNFCHAAHGLFVDSAYSLSDIIRCNDFWNQVQVTHQNWGEVHPR